MTKREIAKLLKAARAHANEEISGHAARGGLYARGLAGEGYSGGYRDALEDVLLLLESGTMPNRRHYWRNRAAATPEGP